MGTAGEFVVPVKITKRSRVPGRNQVVLEGFIDSDEAYDAIEGLPTPPIDVLPGLQRITARVTNLSASVAGSVDEPIVHLRWRSENSTRYRTQISYDGGTTAIDLPDDDLRDMYIEARPDPSITTIVYFRVAGENLFLGPWTDWIEVDLDPSVFDVPASVTGLQLREAFTGRSCKIEWDPEYEFVRVDVVAGEVVMLSTQVRGAQYDLDHLTARNAGIGRAFTFRVYALSSAGVASDTPATLAVSNPAPAVPSNISAVATMTAALISFDPVDADDFVGVSIWASTDAGFAPSDSNKLRGPIGGRVAGIELTAAQTLYVRIAAEDVWGQEDLNYSGEYTLAAAKIASTQIADGFIQTPMLAANVITGDKVSAGTLTAIHVAAESISVDKLRIDNAVLDADGDKLTVKLSGVTYDLLAPRAAGVLNVTSAAGNPYMGANETVDVLTTAVFQGPPLSTDIVYRMILQRIGTLSGGSATVMRVYWRKASTAGGVAAETWALLAQNSIISADALQYLSNKISWTDHDWWMQMRVEYETVNIGEYLFQRGYQQPLLDVLATYR